MYFGDRNLSASPKPDPEKERLAEQNALLRRLLEQQQKAKAASPRSKQVALWCGILLVLALLIGSGIFFYAHRGTEVLPKSVTQNAGFPLYYPAPLPAGYRYKPGSAKLANGVLFYDLQNGANEVTISEQAAPSSVPDFTKLPGFSTMQTPAGSGVAGTLQQKPIAIITGSTTLINITGAKSVPSNDVESIAKNMTALSGQ